VIEADGAIERVGFGAAICRAWTISRRGLAAIGRLSRSSRS